MKNLKKIVVFLAMISMLLCTWASADSPINTIIDYSDPDGASFNGLVNQDPEQVTINERNVNDDNGGWLMDIINSIIGILSGGLLLPLLAIFGIDQVSKIIFNYEPMVQLSFFNPNAANGAAPSLMKAIAPVYVAFRYLAIICYVAIVLYLAIRMLLSTVSRQKAMYKELIKHWLTGVIILLTFNWLMTYTIVIADTLTAILASSVGYNGSNMASNFMSGAIGSYSTIISTGIIAPIYILCLCGMSVAIWWTYLKRVFTVGLLIMIFPLVTITYVFDKIGDRKSQILNAWVKEYMHNVFLQPIQALALVLICIAMQTVGSGSLFSPIIKLIMLFMLFPAEKLLKKIFDVNPTIGGKGFSGSGAGLVSGAMAAAQAIPVLKNNVKNFRDIKTTNAAAALAQRQYDKGQLSQEKLAEAKAKAAAAKGRAFELATGTAGTAFGMGLTGNFGQALGIGAAFDKGTGWAADKYGNFSAKKALTSSYDEMKSAVNGNGKLTDSQKQSLAKRMNISTTALDNLLKNPGGRSMINDFLDMEQKAGLAKLKGGDADAELIRAQYADKLKIGKDGKFYDNGAEIGNLGNLRVGKSGIFALDENGDIRKNLLDADGKQYKHPKLSDDAQLDYGINISGDPGPVELCKDQKDRAAANARRETLESAGLENASVEEQNKYLENDGKKRYTDNYTKARNDEIQIVEELRESTGIRNLQVTSVVEVQPSQVTVQQPINVQGSNVPQAMPPVDMTQFQNSMVEVIKTALTSAGTSSYQNMPDTWKGTVNNVMQQMPSGASDSDIRSAVKDVCKEMSQENLRQMENLTKTFLENSQQVQKYNSMWLSSSSDSGNVHLSNSQKNSEMLAASREAAKKAGLDASW